ncbi:MAG TPA: zinc-binding dehydrogenase [Candidatus Binatia bacterium]|nr:zinc-binding dehydrogenase [Candidatus Binatia bacterium]
MRAVTLRRAGPPATLRVEEAPEPHPGPGEVLIQVQAAGVNFTDVLSRQGLNPEAPPRPFVLGHETSGDVIALGEGVDRFRVGQRVLAYHLTGGYAERIAVPAEQVIAIPDSLAYQCAATLPLNYGTAYVALYRTGPVEPGMRIFIHAAAGGVGMAAVDLARRAGLEMTGAAGTHFKRARLLSEGVKHVVQSRHLHIARLGQRIYGGRAYDIVLDSVGGPTIRDGLKSLRPGGRVVSLGVSGLSGKGVLGALSYLLRAPRFTFIDLLRPSLGLHGVNLRELIRNRALMRKVLEELVSLADLGEITPQPGRVMGLAEAGEAHRLLQSRANVGKIVLRM